MRDVTRCRYYRAMPVYEELRPGVPFFWTTEKREGQAPPYIHFPVLDYIRRGASRSAREKAAPRRARLHYFR